MSTGSHITATRPTVARTSSPAAHGNAARSDVAAAPVKLSSIRKQFVAMLAGSMALAVVVTGVSVFYLVQADSQTGIIVVIAVAVVCGLAQWVQATRTASGLRRSAAPCCR